MKRFSLLVALLGVFFSPLTRAEAPAMCTSMCASDKQQCAKRAGTLTKLDDFKGEEKNPLADTANRMRSETARSAERSDFTKRKRERLDVCDASYLRCPRACGPAMPAASKKAESGK
ncbi:hypothetical protein [uncultured Massilia sp.]|uniref:hypothetical protein n=1 Tax=uncultured Massilia sp. TaxID=169973 RepID=UPI002589BEE8|nr:hypothetical protein [uncultured Massilia sp.]